MKELKQTIIDELLAKLNASPFLLVVDYAKMTVVEFTQLRNKLAESGGEIHVTKNSFVKRAAKDASYPEELNAALVGQTAVVTGQSDVCAAAKAIKDFNKTSKKAAVLGGVLDGKLLAVNDIDALAALPPLEVLRGQLLGTILAPASTLVRLLNEPAASLARVLKAKADQG